MVVVWVVMYMSKKHQIRMANFVFRAMQRDKATQEKMRSSVNYTRNDKNMSRLRIGFEKGNVSTEAAQLCNNNSEYKHFKLQARSTSSLKNHLSHPLVVLVTMSCSFQMFDINPFVAQCAIICMLLDFLTVRASL